MGEALITRRGGNTSDANAQAQHILTGYSGYVNGVKINGSIPIINEDGSGHKQTTQNKIHTHTDGNKYICFKIPNNSYSNNISWYKDNANTLIPQNIKSGVSILGVNGNMSSGASYKSGTNYEIVTLNQGYCEVLSGLWKYTNGPCLRVSNIGFEPKGFVALLYSGEYAFLRLISGSDRQFTSYQHPVNMLVQGWTTLSPTQNFWNGTSITIPYFLTNGITKVEWEAWG